MKEYVDSSTLVAVYVPERFSPAARRIVREAKQVPFTALHDLEVRNAFELLVGRRLISRPECQAIVAQLQDDLDARRLVRVALDFDHVFFEAARLSGLYSAKFFTRSLDLLHVVAAHALACTTLVSADDRQLATSRATGLRAVDIKARGRSRPK